MGRFFEVVLVGLKGARYTIDVANSEEEFKKTTVRKFRGLVAQTIQKEANLLNVDPGIIQLLFGAAQLQDTQTFYDYEIVSQSNIFMILKLPGGGDGRVTSLLKQQ